LGKFTLDSTFRLAAQNDPSLCQAVPGGEVRIVERTGERGPVPRSHLSCPRRAKRRLRGIDVDLEVWGDVIDLAELRAERDRLAAAVGR
jgi:hypothetical protein